MQSIVGWLSINSGIDTFGFNYNSGYYKIIQELKLVSFLPGLGSWQKLQFEKLLAYSLTLYANEKTWPPIPRTDFERSDYYSSVITFYDLLLKEDQHRVRDNFQQLINVDPIYILVLQGMRITEGSVDTYPTFPDKKYLIDLATSKYNNYLSQLARARSKHAFRCKSNYWGKISGSPNVQNAESLDYLYELLNNFTWWNYFGHFKNEIIFEMRDRTGHGMRWEYTPDNQRFIGLVEPKDPNLPMT